MNARVLVTGNQGYIGVELTRFLEAQGYRVVGLDSMYFDGCDVARPANGIEKQIRKDIRDVDAKDIYGVQAVVHLAGLSNDPLGELSPSLTGDINHRASVRLAQLAKQQGAERFVFASSCSVYGMAADERPITEEGTINPLTEYAKSKALVERDLAPLADGSFHPVYLRNATVYGTSSRLRLDLVVNNLVAWAYLTGKVAIMSDGTPWRPLLHVRDFCRAVLAVLEAPAHLITNQTFNVGRNEDNHRVRDIAEVVQAVVPGSTVEILNKTSSDERTYRVDFSKIVNRLPNFKAECSLRQGVEELHESYQRFGLVREDLDTAKYFRVRWINRLLSEGQLNLQLRWVGQS